MKPNVADDPYTAIEKRSLAEYTPLRAMLELTYRCNFRCVHCYLVDFKSPGELSLAEIEGVLDQLAAAGCLVVTLTGGEPLVRRDFFEIAEAARARRFALRLFTNGLLIDEAAADRLAKIEPISTEVSLYGMTDETYAAVTGARAVGRAARVRDAIRLLRERGLTVKIKVPVLQQNVHEIEAMQAFAAEVGAGFAANPNITPKDDGDLSPLAHRLDDDALIDYYRRFVPPRPSKPMPADGNMCNTGRNALVVSPMGDVFPCVQIKTSIGNVRERSIASIWQGGELLDELRALRVSDYERAAESTAAAAKPACASCTGCGSGAGRGRGRDTSSYAGPGQCAGIARATTGRFTGIDPLAERLERLRSRAEAPEPASEEDEASHG